MFAKEILFNTHAIWAIAPASVHNKKSVCCEGDKEEVVVCGVLYDVYDTR